MRITGMNAQATHLQSVINRAVMNRAVDEYIEVTFFNAQRIQIDGITVSIDDEHSDADAFSAVDEHSPRDPAAVYGEIYIWRAGQALAFTFTFDFGA